jgi:hypothetical protein
MSGTTHGDASGIFRAVVLVVSFILYSLLLCIVASFCLRLS